MRILILLESEDSYNRLKLSLQGHEVSPFITDNRSFVEMLSNFGPDVAVIDGKLIWADSAKKQCIRLGIIVLNWQDNDVENIERQIKKLDFSDSESSAHVNLGTGTFSISRDPISAKNDQSEVRITERIVDREVIVEVPVPYEVRVEVPVEVRVEVPVEVKVDRIVETERLEFFPKKTIVIGSLYPGAGSSFVALSLVRILNHMGIASALVESPVCEPELYSMLYGEKNAPQGYDYISDQIVREGRITRRNTEWEIGSTTFLPANPLKTIENWSYEQTYKLLGSLKSLVVVYDVSTHWEHPSVKEICLDAEEILMVCDSLPYKFNRTDTLRTTRYLNILNKSAKSMRLIGNKNTDFKNRVDWIKAMQMEPIWLHPEINFKSVIDSIWNGEIVQDQKEIMDRLLATSYPLIRQLVPPFYQAKLVQEKKGFFAKIFK